MLKISGEGGEFATLEPASATKHLSSLEAKMFITTVDDKSGGLSGHQLFVASGTGAVTMLPVWTLSNPGTKVRTCLLRIFRASLCKICIFNFHCSISLWTIVGFPL